MSGESLLPIGIVPILSVPLLQKHFMKGQQKYKSFSSCSCVLMKVLYAHLLQKTLQVYLEEAVEFGKMCREGPTI